MPKAVLVVESRDDNQATCKSLFSERGGTGVSSHYFLCSFAGDQEGTEEHLSEAEGWVLCVDRNANRGSFQAAVSGSTATQSIQQSHSAQTEQTFWW